MVTTRQSGQNCCVELHELLKQLPLLLNGIKISLWSKHCSVFQSSENVDFSYYEIPELYIIEVFFINYAIKKQKKSL